MKQIAIISSDESLRRIFAIALETADGEMQISEFDSYGGTFTDGEYDVVILLGAAQVVSGRFPIDEIGRRATSRPKVYVISWQHGEQTVLGILECGVNQYMTFPLNINRLLLKIIG